MSLDIQNETPEVNIAYCADDISKLLVYNSAKIMHFIHRTSGKLRWHDRCGCCGLLMPIMQMNYVLHGTENDRVLNLELYTYSSKTN